MTDSVEIEYLKASGLIAGQEDAIYFVDKGRGYELLVLISEWEKLKTQVDDTIFEQKGIDIENMTDEQKQERRDKLLGWLNEIN